TDDSGRRTPDSVLANELYHELTRAGFKVFFARITLEDKLGTAYEPYIFAALNSARVMVVIGTKPEYFNAVWVKNEWSRYLALIRNEKNGTGNNGSPRVLIPAYRDMDPYDLPEEFSHLQAQDMSKLGFMQDLIRGIRKILGSALSQVSDTAADNLTGASDVADHNGTSGVDAAIAPLLKRVFLFLEDGDWEEADEYCEKVLDRDPENARAYLGKLMASLYCHTPETLSELDTPFDENEHYKKVLRFADSSLKAKIIDDAASAQKNHILTTAIAAQEEDSVPQLEEAIKLYAQIPNWKDADERAVACQARIDEKVKDYALEKGAAEQSKDTIPALQQAVKLFESVSGWKNADQRAELCRKRIEVLRQEAEAEEKRKKRNRKIRNTTVAVLAFVLVIVMILQVWIFPAYHYHRGEMLRDAGDNIGAITEFQKAGGYQNARVILTDMINKTCMPVIAVSKNSGITAGLKTDGTVVTAKGYRVSDWTDIVAVTLGEDHIVGLKSDGTVVATGANYYGQCDVTGWTDIVAVAAEDDATIGLKSDGTVVTTNDDDEASRWSDIVAVSTGYWYTVGLKSNGTVVTTNDDHDVSRWTDIVAVAAGRRHTVGLRSNGTVVATGDNEDGQCDVSDWRDIVAVSAGYNFTIGLKSDGTVEMTDDYYRRGRESEVRRWTDIISVAAGDTYMVGLKVDGTVEKADFYGDSYALGWTNIGPRA
ncbi:MAG: TIR domain-containing protein, partial [Clostridiales bacterium]|nr:TIR domain-containing protein [Clostridiales bacterium]